MSNELAAQISIIEREYDIDRGVILDAIKKAMVDAARKSPLVSNDVEVEIDPKSCAMEIYQNLLVSDTQRGNGYITLRRARAVNPDAKEGDFIRVKTSAPEFGRISAAFVKQALTMVLREAQHTRLMERFRNLVGDIVSGEVLRVVRGDIYVNLDGTEAILPSKEQVRAEANLFSPGDPIHALLLRVQDATMSSSSPFLVLSRRSPEFIRALFTREVGEIKDGVVEIMGIARDEGFRTKIAVRALDEKIDPVGACVGVRGQRVKNIVKELNGEKLDIVAWNRDILAFGREAMQPAKVLSIQQDINDPRRLVICVPDDQYTLAIGRRGQNARLTAQILGCRIDIHRPEPDQSNLEKMQGYLQQLQLIDGVNEDVAAELVRRGFLTPEGLSYYSNADELYRALVEGRTDDSKMSLPFDLVEQMWRSARMLAAPAEPAPLPEPETLVDDLPEPAPSEPAQEQGLF